MIMTQDQLHALYEKLYFNEIDSREKIHARLQLPLTLIVAILGALLFLVGRIEYTYDEWSLVKFVFALFLLGSIISLLVAIVYFAHALYNNEYYFLPDSKATMEYWKQCEEVFKEQPNSEALVQRAMSDYINQAYVEYGSFNTAVNDRRSEFIHRCHGVVVLTSGLLLSAFVIFNAGGLYKSKTGQTSGQQQNFQQSNSTRSICNG
jgi:hypothetical protein